MTARRNRTHPETSLSERLKEAADRARAQAGELEPGPEQQALLEKARQFEAQIGMNDTFKL